MGTELKLSISIAYKLNLGHWAIMRAICDSGLSPANNAALCADVWPQLLRLYTCVAHCVTQCPHVPRGVCAL